MDRSAFEYYLAQDAVYLQNYSRALARASQLAPDREGQAFWATAARDAIVTEMTLHTGFLRDADTGKAAPSRKHTSITYWQLLDKGAIRFLRRPSCRASGSTLDVGRRLYARRNPDHPFGQWLDTYADRTFAASTAEAIARTEEALASASEPDRVAASDAFRQATRLERDFFAAAGS